MPTPQIHENTIYKDEELSELFDIPMHSIRDLFKNGHIKGRKIGKRWLVSGKALLDLFDASEEEAVKKHKNEKTEEEQL